MTYVLAVFRSRTQTMRFADEMRVAGVRCDVVSTPIEARVGCGLSARFHLCDLTLARRIIYRYGLTGFVCFVEVIRMAGQTVIRRI